MTQIGMSVQLKYYHIYAFCQGKKRRYGGNIMSTERLVKSFCSLVKTGSETGHEREFCIELEKALIEAGFEVERDEDAGSKCESDGFNIYGYLPGEGEGVLLSCHTDTVTPGNNIIPVERDGVIYSQGDTILGSDDKSGIAEIIEAVLRLRESGTKHRPVEVLFSLSEEVGMLGSRYADYGKIKSKCALVLDSEDIGEVVNSAAANIVMSFTFSGRTAHAGICPENGIHALKAAIYAADRIPVGHVDEISVQNISNFLSPGATNIVADKASFDMEFRSYDEDTVQKHIADALAVMKEACEKFGTTFEYTSERHSGAFTVDPESQFIKDVFSAYERAGIRPYLSKTLGGCDASNIALHDIAVVNIGTGMRDVHTTDENISIKDMEDSTRFLCELLKA